jgi:hypothetical protein
VDRSEPQPPWDDVARRVETGAREAASIAVGLGILGVNRLQSLRRDLTRRLDDALRPDPGGSEPPATE